MQKTLWTVAALAPCLGLVVWIALGTAQGPRRGDYLDSAVREEVTALKQDAVRQPTTAANLKSRLDTLWAWINAYSLTGGPVPVNATLQLATAYRSLEGLRLSGTPPTRGVLRSVDSLIHEFRIKDERPNALGRVDLEVDAPVHTDSWATIKQTYTVGEAALGTGARIMAAKQLQMDGGYPAEPGSRRSKLSFGHDVEPAGKAGRDNDALVWHARWVPLGPRDAFLPGRAGHAQHGRHGHARLWRPPRRLGGLEAANVRN